MKSLFYILIATLISFSAQASNGGRGGGDLCEDQIGLIRADLKNWINAGGSEGLSLTGVTAGEYSKVMVEKIDSTKVRCVSEGDNFYPVQIDGTPKVCRFDFDEHESWITCDANKFMSDTASDQYVLIHHEYAGLAGLENPNGDQSKYFISNQISSFLTSTIAKKLYVKSNRTGPMTYKDIINLGFIPYLEMNSASQYCNAYGAHMPSAREFAEIALSAGATGIRETAYPGLNITDPLIAEEEKNNAKEGYYMISRPASDGGSIVYFYFNGDGFRYDLFKTALPSVNTNPFALGYASRFWMSSYISFTNQKNEISLLIFARSRIAVNESAVFVPVDYDNRQISTICLPGLK